MSLLSLRNVSAFYGQSQALSCVDLDVEQGALVALMGRNGMGKSTTIKVILQMLPAAGGEIAFDGKDLRALPSHKAARLGIGLVPEGRRCFRSLSVEENLLAAARKGHWDIARVGEIFPRLLERCKQSAGSLSGGEQQMLAIGRALMTNPRLMVLDEATEGLAPLVRQDIWNAISTLKRESGLSFLIVDKTLKEISAVADKIVVMARGETVWNGAPNALTPEITDRYLGV
ncbi:ABC transporter ATP-binding protein [Halocynthiibacter sp. C4]|uniref:ABC transporter ATP-binding protein n=1 Tax=Halocynthiibacter sp. C4 TaxID=2992758 RepID=UPI00237AE7B6|nr:ABC transporter ATP-binding protein [Halocynthiibacter sp. C4]MDE0590584.1 ABC transporter ATP-binding protein [Halocynthiibacter sp. C4]